MSEKIRVLQCFNCETFQVDIVKKTKKWKCRLCGVQQTLRKVIFIGSGLECRAKAQELNMQKGQKQKEDFNSLLLLLNDGDVKNCINSNINDDNNISINSRKHLYRNYNYDKKSDSFETNVKKDAFEMFDFSNTKKWSYINNLLPSKRDINMANQTIKDDGDVHKYSNVEKISKWNDYV